MEKSWWSKELKTFLNYYPYLSIKNTTNVDIVIYTFVKSLQLLPEQWGWEYWLTVSEFIMEIVNHAEDFVNNAKRILQ